MAPQPVKKPISYRKLQILDEGFDSLEFNHEIEKQMRETEARHLNHDEPEQKE